MLQILVDPTVAVITSIIAGVAGGFLSSWMAFNASGEQFNGRKHGNALITGALTGIFIGIAQTLANPEDVPMPAFVIATLTTFLSAVGLDRLRSSGSHMTAKSTSTTTTTTTPAVK